MFCSKKSAENIEFLELRILDYVHFINIQFKIFLNLSARLPNDEEYNDEYYDENGGKLYTYCFNNRTQNWNDFSIFMTIHRGR